MPVQPGLYQSGLMQGQKHQADLRRAATEDTASKLDIKTKQIELQKNEDFMNLIKGDTLDGKTTSPDQVAGLIERRGMAAMAAGLTVEGQNLLSAASNIKTQDAQRERSQAITRRENMGRLANLYRGIQTKQQWDAANAAYTQQTGEVSPYADVPFTPQTVQLAINGARTEQQAANVRIAEAREKLLNSQIKTDEKRREEIDSQDRLNESRIESAEKTGNKPVPGAYITHTKNYLKSQLETIGDYPGVAEAKALPLAEKAYDLVHNQGYSMSQAIVTVVDEAIAEGKLGGFTTASSHRPGEHRSKPMPLPDQKTWVTVKNSAGQDVKVPDEKSLKVNKYYTMPDGSLALYMGGGTFRPVDPNEEDEPEDLSGEVPEYDEEDEESYAEDEE